VVAPLLWIEDGMPECVDEPGGLGGAFVRDRGTVDKKNSDFTRVGTNFVYNLQGRKESKISGDVNRREFQGSVGSEASEGKSEGGKFRGEKIQRSV